MGIKDTPPPIVQDTYANKEDPEDQMYETDNVDDLIDHNASAGVEFFECQKCSEYNIIRSNPRHRRVTRVRHVKIDDVVWASLKRYLVINNVTVNYGIMLLLFNAKSKDIQYLLSDRHLVDKKSRGNKNNNANQ